MKRRQHAPKKGGTRGGERAHSYTSSASFHSVINRWLKNLDSITIKFGSMDRPPKKSRVRTGLLLLRLRRFGGQDVWLCGSNLLSRQEPINLGNVLHTDRRLLGDGEEGVLLGDVVFE
jgi:hypothetical protein